jgi:hypothetical protein
LEASKRASAGANIHWASVRAYEEKSRLVTGVDFRE